MGEETLVFSRRDCIDQHLRYVLELNDAPLHARYAEKICHRPRRRPINLCAVLENLVVQPEIDNPRVLFIEMGCEGPRNDAKNHEHQ